jgi:hypothetical protein
MFAINCKDRKSLLPKKIIFIVLSMKINGDGVATLLIGNNCFAW